MGKNSVADWAIKAGAVVLAVLLWFHAVTEQTYQSQFEIPLRIDELESDSSRPQRIVANPTPSTVTVLVSGTGKDLLQLNPSDLVAILTPYGTPGSTRTYRIGLDDVEIRRPELGVAVEEIVEPQEIQIELDRRSSKVVPVIPRLQLQVADAHTRVGAVQIVPAEVTVSGPSKQVRLVKQIETDSLVRQNVAEPIDQVVLLRGPERTRLDIAPDRVSVRADIQALAEDDIDDVPVAIRHGRGKSVATEPARVSVKVKGAVGIIASLKREDLRLYVDYRDFSGGALRVLAAVDSLIEIRRIDPPEVNLVEY